MSLVMIVGTIVGIHVQTTALLRPTAAALSADKWMDRSGATCHLIMVLLFWEFASIYLHLYQPDGGVVPTDTYLV